MKSIGRVILFIAVAAVLAACGSTAEEPSAFAPDHLDVTFGQPDGTQHPWVVTLLFQQQSGLYSCSGTLLSEYVVLTAGHCTEENGVANLATWVRNDPVIDPVAEIPTYGGLVPWLDALWVTGTAVPHPEYSDFAEFPATYDVGLVLLDEPISVSAHGVLPEIGLLDELMKGNGAKQRRFTAVGYGLQGLIPPFEQTDWERYVGESTLINVNSAYAGDDQSAGFTNNPGKGDGSGGTCFGDSGGPLFWKDTNVIGAVVSFGFTPCIGIDYQFRMDTAIAQDFVEPYLDWEPVP